MEAEHQSGQKALAWAVHAFTASGTVLAFLALSAAIEERYSLALLWLLIALIVDGVDGSLARWAKVGERAPRIDGNTLDLIIDYLNYVFVPTFIILRSNPAPALLSAILAAAILISALYNFTRKDLKTEDNYFRGFPALWNVVAFYLLVTRPGMAATAATICFFAAFTFAPVHFVHPFRVRDYGRWLPLLACLWAVATGALLWPDLGAGALNLWLLLSLGASALLILLGLIRTVRGPKLSPAPLHP